jgi:hypothetical protein
MTDYNIHNRVSFDDMRKSFKVSVQPFIVEGGGVLDLGGPANVFWIKQVSWKYEYIDVGIPNAKQIRPINKIRVSVENVLNDVDTALPPFTEPKPVVGKVHFRVHNTNLQNNHKLEVEFFLDGVLVTPRPGQEPPTLKQMKGYVMLDQTSRGQIALDEDAADQLDQTLTQLGLGNLRDKLPGGLTALKQLPAPFQTAIIHGLISKGELPEAMMPSLMMAGMAPGGTSQLALPDADPAKETSAFMGDLLAACPEDVLKTSQLKEIAAAMVEKGWRRV